MNLRLIDACAFNHWQAERHYLRRPIIRSKMLAHGVFCEGKLVGGLLWSTPHFTRKKGLFGMPGLLDQWEVLMLARFYLEDGSNVIASQALAKSIGCGNGRGSHRRGWRLQEDWVRLFPPRFPQNPFVPRLLISWSDLQYGHEGTIYKASGWEFWDKTNVNYSRNASGTRSRDGHKRCWIMRLGANPRAEGLGLESAVLQLSLKLVAT